MEKLVLEIPLKISFIKASKQLSDFKKKVKNSSLNINPVLNLKRSKKSLLEFRNRINSTKASIKVDLNLSKGNRKLASLSKNISNVNVDNDDIKDKKKKVLDNKEYLTSKKKQDSDLKSAKSSLEISKKLSKINSDKKRELNNESKKDIYNSISDSDKLLKLSSSKFNNTLDSITQPIQSLFNKLNNSSSKLLSLTKSAIGITTTALLLDYKLNKSASSASLAGFNSGISGTSYQQLSSNDIGKSYLGLLNRSIPLTNSLDYRSLSRRASTLSSAFGATKLYPYIGNLYNANSSQDFTNKAIEDARKFYISKSKGLNNKQKFSLISEISDTFNKAGLNNIIGPALLKEYFPSNLKKLTNIEPTSGVFDQLKSIKTAANYELTAKNISISAQTVDMNVRDSISTINNSGTRSVEQLNTNSDLIYALGPNFSPTDSLGLSESIPSSHYGTPVK